ncbi:uncharacterized protein LOC121382616 [Gigantopelta aegis]|uniref:uncharacterized protein LOC121382616 n=1 Tax=Gigantopelta aegis TaxID=1735272 RepID=UPI001B88A3D6|nr:uncharacterized protein LOC121382616 [Gigantopelta aegis]
MVMLLWLVHLLYFINVQGSAISNLRTIEREFWDWRLRDAPEFASVAGVNKYNDRLTSFSLASFQNRHNKVEEFLTRVKAIDTSTLTPHEHIDYVILKDHLQTYIDGYSWRLYEPINPINFLEGLHTNPQHFLDTMPYISRGDFENLIERLEKIPRQLSEYVDLMREAIRLNHTQNKVSVEPVSGQIDKLLVDDPSHSVFYKPFTHHLDHSHVPHSERYRLRERAKHAITIVLKAFKSLKNFIINEYMHATRRSWGVQDWDHGTKNYEACLRWHLSLDVTPREVHDLGLREVQRIRGEMTQAMGRLGYSGSIPDFFGMIRKDPRFHVNSAETLLRRYDDIIYKKAFPKMKTLFKDIPDLPLKVERMPFNGPGGEYLAGTADGSRPGVFYVNLQHPEDTATIDMVALSLHETVPGHHLQSIYALSTDLPSYRKFQEDDNYYQTPLKFPLYTAYLEGWGLYAEYLGEELGLYSDDYELMGRYSSEMFRACRLVVDTGLHYFDWTQERAIEYMLNNTAYSRNDLTTEVNRYMTWPGQACAYKVGELKLKELRQKASTQLGSRFDVKEFHSIVLNNGPVPLRVLEQLIDAWIHKGQGHSIQPIG